MFKKYFLLILTGFIFGSQFLFTKFALQGYSALGIGMIRVVLGTLVVALLTPIFSNKERLTIKWFHYAIIGFLEGALPCVLVPWGQQYVQSSIAAILISTMPIFAMFLGPVFIKNSKISLLDTLCIITGFIGVVILINPTAGTNWLDKLLPELAILLAAVSWALSLVLIKKLPEVSPVKLTRNILYAASIEIIFIWLVVSHPTAIHIAWIPLLCAVILGVFSSGIVYIFYVLLIQSSGVNFASFSNYLVPIVGILFGVLLLNNKFNLHEIIGCGVIASALIIQTYKDLRKKKVKA